MPTILIIKTGSTLPALKAQKGDFEDWTRAGMDPNGAEVQVVDVVAGEPLPAYEAVAGVAVTGSHSMVTERLAWSERTAEWLAGAVAHHVPTLGICYGHQLLAHALGGAVADNPLGREYGTVEVRLAEPARTDLLLGDLPDPLPVQVCHTQSVLRLPEGAVRLASGARDANQAFRVGACAWGVQFHPEFDAAVVRAYIDHMRPLLAAENQNADQLRATCVDHPYGSEILRRFARLALEA